jgi:hypothetical protein
MDLEMQTEEFGNGDLSWIAEWKRTYPGRSITLDGDLFDDPPFTDGLVRSGTVLGVVTATGLYGPYDDAAADGREVAAGHLLHDRTVRPGARFGAALIWTGRLFAGNLPANSGFNPAARADLAAHIVYS